MTPSYSTTTDVALALAGGPYTGSVAMNFTVEVVSDTAVPNTFRYAMQFAAGGSAMRLSNAWLCTTIGSSDWQLAHRNASIGVVGGVCNERVASSSNGSRKRCTRCDDCLGKHSWSFGGTSFLRSHLSYCCVVTPLQVGFMMMEQSARYTFSVSEVGVFSAVSPLGVQRSLEQCSSRGHCISATGKCQCTAGYGMMSPVAFLQRSEP